MSALKQKAVQMLEQLPEETSSPKMTAFLELEQMLIPASEDLDYDKELAEARDEKYGRID